MMTRPATTNVAEVLEATLSTESGSYTVNLVDGVQEVAEAQRQIAEALQEMAGNL
jgi:hypothetical protein